MARALARIVVLTVVLAALTAVPATAQSRWDTSMPVFLGLVRSGFLITVAPPDFTGCSEGFVAINTPGLPNLDLWSGVLVLDDGAPLFNLHYLFTPLGAQNITWQNDVWLRVFRLQQGDLTAYLEQPCTFYVTHPYVAEGLARMNYTSADDALNGPGVNSWGWTILGDLNDQGYCPAGQSPRLFWLQRYVVRSQTDILTAKSTSSKGPTLTCK